MNDDHILCHCFAVTRSQVNDAISVMNPTNMEEVMCATDAGQGCMGCRRKLKEMLQNRCQQSEIAEAC